MAGAVAPMALVVLWGQLAGKGFHDTHEKQAPFHCKKGCKHKAPYHATTRRFLWTWSHKVDAPWRQGQHKKRTNCKLVVVGPSAEAFAALPAGETVRINGHLGNNGVWVDSWEICTEDQARQQLAMMIS